MLAGVVTVGVLLAASGWNVSMDAQTRARDEPTVDGRARLGELDLRANLGVSTSGPDGAAALNYLSSVLLTEAISGPADVGNATQQGARLELKTRLAPATRLTSRTSFDLGLTDFSPLSAQATRPVVGQLPPQRFVRTLGVDTMLDMTHDFSRRLHVTLVAAVQRSGGVGHEAVSVLPFQVRTQATASLAWAADRTNAVTIRWSGSHSRFSIDATSVLTGMEASWTSRASPRTTLDAGAGLVFVHSSRTEVESEAVYGAGAAGLAWSIPVAPQRALRTAFHLRLVPGIDQFTALAVQTIGADAAAEFTQGALRFGLTGSGTRIISGVSDGADQLHFEARSSWTAHSWSLEGGIGAARTNQLAFAGWAVQALVGLRWTASGWF